MCKILYQLDGRFQAQPATIHLPATFPARKDSWHHCCECRNRTARWQSIIITRYVRKYETRSVLSVCLNASNGGNLSQDEEASIFARFENLFRNNYPHAGLLVVLDTGDNGRPHWHGLVLGIAEHEVGEAWHKACEGFKAWCRVGEIETSVKRTVDYMFKAWGYSNGKPIPVPKQGVKVIRMVSFFKVRTKGAIEQELLAERREWQARQDAERPVKRYRPDDIEDELEHYIKRYHHEKISSAM